LLRNELERYKILEAEAHEKAKKFEAIYTDLSTQFTDVTSEKNSLQQETSSLTKIVEEQRELLD
jgi:predicted  nucleic acid-binding Zn-ribbon protein